MDAHIEYFKKVLKSAKINLECAECGGRAEEAANIALKIGHYEAAISALENT